MYGPLVEVYLRYPKTSKVFLTMRWAFYRVLLGKSTCTKLKIACERGLPSLSQLPMDGLSLGELEALTTEGRLSPVNGGNQMDMFMKVLMGGWLPQGKRTQMVAAATALGALLMAFVQWASGEMALTELLKLVADKWEVFVLAFGAYFMAEKVDAVKEEVKK